MIEKRYDLLISQLYEKIPINERNNNKKNFFQQIACLTANKNETSGAFLNSTLQSFCNKFSDKEFSTLLCPRYNLDLDYIPTNLQCTCKRKNKITGKMQPKFIDKKGFHICNACNSDGCPTITRCNPKCRCFSFQKWRLSCG